jgi:hypothetical protein
MGDLFWIIVIVTSIWVLIDAKTIGVKKGQIQGMGNIGPWGWFFVCLLLWIVGFPFYLAKRSEFKRINTELQQGNQPVAAATLTQGKKSLSVIHWIGIIVFGGIAWLALFGQRDDGTTGVGRIASGGNSSYVVRVEGSPGLSFSGSYMGITGGGSQQQSVDGTVPASYTVSGSIVSATFQKQSENGALTVSIEMNGHIVQKSSTSASYGVVSVASN